jgi:hypothetical protein
MKLKFNFGGLMGVMIGTLISASAIQQKSYFWLIGSIPLIATGILMQIDWQGNKKVTK